MATDKSIFDNASDRISELLAEIGEQIMAINSTSDERKINDIIAGNDKNHFIYKQSELISNYIVRDENDPQPERIAELEKQIKNNSADVSYYTKRLSEARNENKLLKQGIKSLSQIIATE